MAARQYVVSARNALSRQALVASHRSGDAPISTSTITQTFNPKEATAATNHPSETQSVSRAIAGFVQAVSQRRPIYQPLPPPVPVVDTNVRRPWVVDETATVASASDRTGEDVTHGIT